MEQNKNVVDDAFWNALRDLIKAYIEGRIHHVDNGGGITFCEIPRREVTFSYSAEELYAPDNKLDKFVDNIILSLRY